MKMLRPLAQAYSGAFRIFAPRGAAVGTENRARRRFAAALTLAAVLVLCLLRVPLRIVAPCEVVPSRLLPVNAPLDGVIREVRVVSGQAVSAGQTLYVYDDTVAREELEVASRQVDVTRSNLERASADARSDRNSRAEAVMLRNRLAQDIVRRDAARARLGKAIVIAPEEGVVVMGDAAELIGRPVGIGEATMTIAPPEENRLRIWLPLDDRIAFDPSAPVRVFLNVDSGRTLAASLSYVAPHATQGEEGGYAFLAEAEWRNGDPGLDLGLKGTAVLYGEKVTLGYWLARKPLAAARRFLGI